MLLALDVGNTNICIGCIEGEKILFTGRLSTDHSKTADEYAISFNSIIRLYGRKASEIDGSIISSVVPPLNQTLRDAVNRLTGTTPLLVGPGVKSGLNILLDNPAQTGSDLVVDAVAAIAQYPKPLIIIDMGTATTVSVVNEQGGYMGGLILPGVRISQDTLTGRTSQLPRIALEPPAHVIGKNTIDCMKSGAIFGQAAMLDGLIERIEEELGHKTTVIATGGLAGCIVPYCKREIIYDNDLLLKGLRIIYEKNRPDSSKR